MRKRPEHSGWGGDGISANLTPERNMSTERDYTPVFYLRCKMMYVSAFCFNGSEIWLSSMISF